MTQSLEGFYSAYITGREGQGLAMLILLGGNIIGADAAGFLINGSYTEGMQGISVSLVTVIPLQLRGLISRIFSAF